MLGLSHVLHVELHCSHMYANDFTHPFAFRIKVWLSQETANVCRYFAFMLRYIETHQTVICVNEAMFPKIFILREERRLL